MHLRTGIPLLSELDAHLASEEYRRHVEFNRAFLARHDAAIQRYGKLWAKDTFRLWSRRWEYPFAAQRVIEFAEAQADGAVRILDAGSGVTYFPYYLCSEIARAEVTCLDSNPSYHEMFRAINESPSPQPSPGVPGEGEDRDAGVATTRGGEGNTSVAPTGRVKFVEAMLQKMPLEDGSFDAVCCISVLEHTDNYNEILDEFRRVLRPGGLLVLTFDLSLDGKFELAKPRAAELLRSIMKRFDAAGDADLVKELDRMDRAEDEGILTTDYIRKTEPDLLPWKYPVLKAAHDLVTGHGWTGGFRSKSVYCLDVKAR